MLNSNLLHSCTDRTDYFLIHSSYYISQTFLRQYCKPSESIEGLKCTDVSMPHILKSLLLLLWNKNANDFISLSMTPNEIYARTFKTHTHSAMGWGDTVAAY